MQFGRYYETNESISWTRCMLQLGHTLLHAVVCQKLSIEGSRCISLVYSTWIQRSNTLRPQNEVETGSTWTYLHKISECRLYHHGFHRGHNKSKLWNHIAGLTSNNIIGKTWRLWIQNQAVKWKTFVANHVSQIQSDSDLKQWEHVPTNLNPADIASRGSLL